MVCSAGADRPRRVGARRRQKRPRLLRQLPACQNTRRAREAQGEERKDSPVAGALASASTGQLDIRSRRGPSRPVTAKAGLEMRLVNKLQLVMSSLMLNIKRFALLIPLLFAALPVSAQAPDSYPSKPLRFILPFPPGGPTDILGRLIGERLASSLGQPVIVENRGGAGGNVGAEAAAKSAPDGYTLVLAAPSLAISSSLYSKLNYDPLRDFAPVSLVATVPNVIVTLPAAAPHIKSGRLRALAVIAPQRLPALPEVPTVAEAGLPDFEVTTWYGVLAPAGTPRPVVARLNGELVKILSSQDMNDKLNAIGTDPVSSTPEEFAAYLRQEIAKWRDVVRKAGLKAD